MYSTDELVQRGVQALRKMQKVEAAKVGFTTDELSVTNAGFEAHAVAAKTETVQYRGSLSDILAYLQNETELTRSTLVRILKESGRLSEFFANPQRFIEGKNRKLGYYYRLPSGSAQGFSAHFWYRRTRSGNSILAAASRSASQNSLLTLWFSAYASSMSQASSSSLWSRNSWYSARALWLTALADRVFRALARAALTFLWTFFLRASSRHGANGELSSLGRVPCSSLSCFSGVVSLCARTECWVPVASSATAKKRDGSVASNFAILQLR